jgi:hypothetical protein
MADEYLGVRGQAAEGETDRLAELDHKIVELDAPGSRPRPTRSRRGWTPELLAGRDREH